MISGFLRSRPNLDFLRVCQLRLRKNPDTALRCIPRHCGVRQVRLVPRDLQALISGFLRSRPKLDFLQVYKCGPIIPTLFSSCQGFFAGIYIPLNQPFQEEIHDRRNIEHRRGSVPGNYRRFQCRSYCPGARDSGPRGRPPHMRRGRSGPDRRSPSGDRIPRGNGGGHRRARSDPGRHDRPGGCRGCRCGTGPRSLRFRSCRFLFSQQKSGDERVEPKTGLSSPGGTMPAEPHWKRTGFFPDDRPLQFLFFCPGCPRRCPGC